MDRVQVRLVGKPYIHCVLPSLNPRFKVEEPPTAFWKTLNTQISCMNLPPSKTSLRRQLRQARKSLDGYQRDRQQQRIQRLLAAMPQIRDARRIAAYMPFDGEPDLLPFMRRYEKKIWLPMIRPDMHLNFRPAFSLTENATRPSCARRNRFGIIESIHTPNLHSSHMDAILIPLVGYDRLGNRLGMGAGFYDRSLTGLRRPRPWLIGIAFSCQETEHLPADPWDVPLDYIVTNTGIIKTNRYQTRKPE
jgi:5-formyltetrahydrofolate cyclo-ligase